MFYIYCQAVVLKKALIDLTETESKLITFDIMKQADESPENSTAEFPNSDMVNALSICIL